VKLGDLLKVNALVDYGHGEHGMVSLSRCRKPLQSPIEIEVTWGTLGNQKMGGDVKTGQFNGSNYN